jgi:hypothetical protein
MQYIGAILNHSTGRKMQVLIPWRRDITRLAAKMQCRRRAVG